MPKGAYMDDKARNAGRNDGREFAKNNPQAPTEEVVDTAGDGAVRYYRSGTGTRIVDLDDYIQGWEEGFRGTERGGGFEGETGGDGGESGS